IRANPHSSMIGMNYLIRSSSETRALPFFVNHLWRRDRNENVFHDNLELLGWRSSKRSVKKHIGAVNELLKWNSKHHMQLINYLEQMVHSSVQVPRDIMVINAKHLQTKEKESQAQPTSVKDVPTLAQGEQKTLDDLVTEVYLSAQGENMSSTLVIYSNFVKPLAKKLKAKELVVYEAKRAKMLEEYNHCISFRKDPLPIIKFSYRVNNSTKKATMRITRNHQSFNLVMYDKNLVPPSGVVASKGLVIKEPKLGILFYNGNFD
nr:hypothetical protein [Tanacetum cinerariifolium]